jgi:hypothetical protein
MIQTMMAVSIVVRSPDSATSPTSYA